MSDDTRNGRSDQTDRADQGAQAGRGLKIKLTESLERSLFSALAHSPAGALISSDTERDALKSQLVRETSRILTHAAVSADDIEALALALAALVSREDDSRLRDALIGSLDLLDAFGDTLIAEYLKRLPWGALSERDLRELCYGWRELLGSGDGVNREALWVEGASITPSRWREVGLHQALERAALNALDLLVTPDNGTDHADPAQEPKTQHALIGIRLSGGGASAHLAYARRWCLARHLEVHWLTRNTQLNVTPDPSASPEHTDSTTRDALTSALIIDDLHLSSRQAQWRVAIALTRAAERSSARGRSGVTLCVWADNGEEEGLGALLASEVDARFDLDLDHAWNTQRELKPHQPHPHESRLKPAWFTDLHPHLTRADHLRLCDLARDIPPHAPRFEVSDIDAYAALLGPVCPIAVLADAAELPLDSTRELLRGSGWIEVDEHPELGPRFVPPTLLFWRAALIEGGARAHRAAPLLIAAVERHHSSELKTLAHVSLRRLERLRGRRYRATLEEPLDPYTAHETLMQLKGALTSLNPSRISLLTLCGLALDWAQLGPALGRWDDAFHALELGVASARRLGDHRGMGRLLSRLGKLALDDGRAAVAESALETAMTLLNAAQLPREAMQTQLSWAEAHILKGELSAALARLACAERDALALGLTAGAWQSRFRVGQLWAQLGEHEHALKVWLTLTPPKVELNEGSAQAPIQVYETGRAEGGQSKTQDKDEDTVSTLQESPRALIALAIECATSLIHLKREGEAWDLLEGREERSWLTQALMALCRWRSRSEDPIPVLERCLKLTQEARDIGAWVALQRWRALVTLELNVIDVENRSSSKQRSKHNLKALETSRLGLELSIRVMSGARDRLQLIALYQQLASIYRVCAQERAGDAALAMAEAWRMTLNLPTEPHEPLYSLKQRAVELNSQLLTDATAEVNALTTLWSREPLSAQLRSTEADVT